MNILILLLWTLQLKNVVVEPGSVSTAPKDPRVEKLSRLQSAMESLYNQGKFNEAIDLARQRLNLTTDVFGHNTLEEAQALNDLAEALGAQGENDQSLHMHEQALKLREQLAGKDSAQTAESLNNLAYLLDTMGNYGKALQLSRQALAIREKLFGTDSLEYATSLENSALIIQDQGDYTTPIPMFRKVLEIRERKLQPESSDTATALSNLGFILEDKGDYVAAREMYERALKIEEKTEGPENPNLATTLNNIAYLLQAQGDQEAAKQNYQRALSIRQKALGNDHPLVAQSLNNLAYLYEDEGQYEQAIPLYQRALTIRENRLGSTHPDVAIELNNMANAIASQKNFAKAKVLYERALAIRNKVFGERHIQVAESLNNLANLARESSADLHNAENWSLQALSIFKETIGPQHPFYARALINLALIEWQSGKLADAHSHLLQAAEIIDTHIDRLLSTLSFTEQRYLLEAQITPLLSLLLSASSDTQFMPKAYEKFFRWKGLLLYYLQEQKSFNALAQNDTSLEMQLDHLRAIRAEIASLYQSSEGPVSEREAKIASLASEKETVERELAKKTGRNAGDPLRILGLHGFQSQLNSNEALIDIYRYTATVDGKNVGEHFAAIVLTSKVSPRLIDLGPADELSKLVTTWFDQASSGKLVADSWNSLLRKAWYPIEQEIPSDVSRLWISPDSALVQIPWNILTLEPNDSRDLLIGQVDSPRELSTLKTQASTKAPARMLLVGGINFGKGTEKFTSLPGTEEEVTSIERLAAQAKLPFTSLKGDAASKKSLTRLMPQFNYVHLATHGFFLRSTLNNNSGATRGISNLIIEPSKHSSSRNPLVESGIALAGANLPPSSKGSDGIITAEELIGLDLGQCLLLTLSACDTGRGEEITGQGVLGLRASIMSSGSKAILMSLWKVPDKSAQQLMEHFYTNLLVGKMSKARALSEAQRTLKDDVSGAFREPLHWAAWTIIGEAW